MKILVDEHIPLMTIRYLRDTGHDVLGIRRTPQQGMDDEVLWDHAQRDGRLLITTDKGFTRYRAELHCGALIVRLRQPNRHRIHQRIMNAMAQHPEESWPGLLVVMRDFAQSSWRSPQSRKM